MAKDNARWLSWEAAQSPWEGARTERRRGIGAVVPQSAQGYSACYRQQKENAQQVRSQGAQGRPVVLSPHSCLSSVAHPAPCSLFRIGCPSAGSFPLPSVLLFIQRCRTALQEGPLDVDSSTVVVMGNISFRICCCNLLSLN